MNDDDDSFSETVWSATFLLQYHYLGNNKQYSGDFTEMGLDFFFFVGGWSFFFGMNGF